ncbi:MAG: protein translocase subunit SecD, partial [Kiritimatiellia bacterium]|nr:protein translocase subunit SecD [Kiritimatiellia bacterium]
MDKNAWIKWILVLVAITLSLALVTPLDKKVKLGLDLQGGSSFVVEVDQAELREQMRKEDIREDEIDRQIGGRTLRARDVALESIRNRLDSLGLAEPAIYPQTEGRITIQMPGIDKKKREDARRTIESVAFLEFRLVHRQSDRWVRRLLEEGRAPRGFQFIQADRPTLIRNRAEVKDDEMDREYRAELRGFAPRDGAEFFVEEDVNETGATIYRPVYVESTIQLTGDAVQDAKVDYDQFQRIQIALEFTRTGSRQFARITRDFAPRGEKNLHSDTGRQLAIILDGTLYSAPVIRSEITGGRAQIEGRFSLSEATRLTNALRSGSLLAPVRIIEERSVDPSLGRDSVRSGTRAAILGGIAVLVFMIAYYAMAGVVANVALFLTCFLLPLGAWIVAGVMGVITGATMSSGVALPTLTLPGIAGLVLTLGMAVDANVLIYERIREELKAGKHLLAAIDAGYDKAFTTILDANVTTLLVAVIMFWQGSGPVRGFAVMLSAGILVSMFTAIYITHLLFHLLVRKGNLKSLKMVEWVRETKIDFLKQSGWGISLSVILMIVSLITFWTRGRDMLGIDFVG